MKPRDLRNLGSGLPILKSMSDAASWIRLPFLHFPCGLQLFCHLVDALFCYSDRSEGIVEPWASYIMY